MNRLQDKTAIITGGAGEIGFAAARKFVEEGARVMLVDLDEEGLKKKAGELAPDQVQYIQADVSQSKDVQAYVKAALDAFGHIDVFFNNAGIEGAVHSIPEYPEEDFQKVVDVNIKGVFLGMKYVMPHMLERKKGSIIITSSVAGLIGNPGMVAYITSKHAVIGIMRTAAAEAAGHGMRVNSVHPGVIDSRMMESLEKGMNPDDPQSVHEAFSQQVPLGRYGKEEEIAHLVTFLASDEASYITGSLYVADGGMTIS
jgi:NAD(P)-dependent dehydrogenase (short-subunit alcohol dehydrogenase family)